MEGFSRTAIFALLLGFSPLPAEAVLPPATAEWYRLDARGVVVFTDGDPDRAEALVSELLRFRAALERALPGGPDRDGRPLVVHLFGQAASFHPYKPISGGEVSAAAGFFMPRREGAFVALRASSASGARIVRHELVHRHVHRLLGSAPPWLDEGLAEYLAACRFEGSALKLGESIPEHADRLAASGALPVDRLVRSPDFAAAHSAGGHARRLYAQSWALVHWLRTGGPESRALFDRLLGELGARGERAADLVALSGLSPGEISLRVAAHLAKEPLPGERVELPAHAAPPLTRRRLDRAEALTALGELLLAEHRPAAAREHFEAARRGRPSLGRAWRGLSLVAEAEGRPVAARPLHEAAAERAPKDPEVLLSLGRNLLGLSAEGFDAERVPKEDAGRAREVLRRAVALDPSRAESLATLGIAGLMTSLEADAETGAALEVAFELLPHRSDVAYHLLLWHVRRGQLEEAGRLLDASVLPREKPGSELAVRAQNVVTLATLERAQALVAEGRRAEARALLEARRAAGVHETLRPQLLRMLRELR